LAQGAYYLESQGEAAIIDPLRETAPYLKMAQQRGAKIKYIFETHFHADFVSGHMDLARETGAQIVYGPTTMETGFDKHVGEDGEIFPLGKVQIQLLHTPGHTMESSCFLLRDEDGKEKAIFTGDTLFIGDVGRPDLAQHVIADLTQEKLAAHLYDSIHSKILPLPDDLVVYPGHGAGSACGKKMSKETMDTLGNQKKTNYALQTHWTKDDFIREVLSGLTPPPSYFPKNVLMNIQGGLPIDEVIYQGTRPLSPEKFEVLSEEEDVLILDTRSASEFAKGFIPGAFNIGIDGGFAVWVGTLITNIHQKMILVVEKGREEEVVTRLARVGYDQSIGFLKGGFESWKEAGKPWETIQQVSPIELHNIMNEHIETNILDVRKKSEFDSEHLLTAENIPLDYLQQNIAAINPNKTYYVHCAAGYRSMMFISILRTKGFKNLIDISGGLGTIKETGLFHLTEYICPSTLL
jgi:glyoxylase-like metal-dependent hydrolase (beta-lactamase superfamily II)/rhodanese-related sulfurtransferase